MQLVVLFRYPPWSLLFPRQIASSDWPKRTVCSNPAIDRLVKTVLDEFGQIDTLLRDPGGDYGVRLKSGITLSVSRNRIEQLERWMGLAS